MFSKLPFFRRDESQKGEDQTGDGGGDRDLRSILLELANMRAANEISDEVFQAACEKVLAKLPRREKQAVKRSNHSQPHYKQRQQFQLGLGHLIIVGVVVAAIISVSSRGERSAQSVSHKAQPAVAATANVQETFRLIHAIGNVEHESARGLSKHECENRRAELKVVAEALGSYNERLGYGSITCLRESYF